MRLSGQLYRINADTGIVYSQKAIELSMKLGSKEDLGYALKNIGLSHYFKSNFSEVLKYWQESLDVFKSIDHVLGISNLQSNLGATYYSLGDNAKALEYLFDSLKFAEELDDEVRMATAYTNIGAVYAEDESTHDLAFENYAKALAISEKIDQKDAIGTTALNIGELYYKQGKPDQALPMLQKGLAAFREIDGNIATALNNIGAAYERKKEYDIALGYHKEAIDLALQKENKLDLAKGYQGVGKAKLGLEQYNDAIKAFRSAESTAIEIKGNNELRDAYEGLAMAYEKTGSYKRAFEFQSNLTDLKDEMRSVENEEKLGNLRVQHDIETKEKEIQLLNKDNELQATQLDSASTFQKFSYALGALLLFIIGGIYFQYRYVQKSHAQLAIERNRAEDILLNILPKDTADELKAKGHVDAREYEQTTVMFTDFKGFTEVSQKVPSNELVDSIDYYFKNFDEIITRFNLEKIKTIGDSYMCAGGLPTANKSNPIDAVKAGIEIMKFVKETHANPPKGIYPFEVRIGMNTGSLVAGVVGTKKFQYDIWGSTVNIASRMESNSEEGKINISDNTYQHIKDYFECNYRGEIEVKNAGLQKMYYVERGLPSLATTY